MANKKIVHIPQISGLASLIEMKESLMNLEGMVDVKIDITTRQARFSWMEPASWEQIETKLSEIGYRTNGV
ncbi:MAG: heavy-metal-associated domain-containing protein [Deltaproteobacteria bacterium]|jgi:hypothetical protein|nr:heavy-metal-associated domain-containing protein [Deltaproteobacteria bacterium]